MPRSSKDPSLPMSLPTTSRHHEDINDYSPRKKRCIDYFYNRDTKEFLGRTCSSWLYIFAYSIMYLIFLGTFFLIILYASLHVVRYRVDFKNIDRVELYTYAENGIGLSATPTSETNYPLIWYKEGNKDDYKKYVTALDKLLSTKRRKREVSNLGPCGEAPYGYGERPCVIVRINKQWNWYGAPLQSNSTTTKLAPHEVQQWIKADKTKLWLQCSGYHAYDREHIGNIMYYPYPPGYDAKAFPLEKNKTSPLVAIQITDFAVGVSLAIKCNLWYDSGPSTVEFILYVAPENKKSNGTTSINV